MRYIYGWTPLVVVGSVVLLALPWLALIAVLIAVPATLAALAVLAWSIVAAPRAAGRAIGRRWHGRSPAPRPSPARSLTESRRVYLEMSAKAEPLESVPYASRIRHVVRP